MTENYLTSARRQFEYYKSLGDKTFDQLPDDALYWAPNTYSNSIATIIKHLHGNMLSRWTDFLMSDGEKEWRDRDGEFVVDFEGREALLQLWEEGWSRVFEALDTINEENFDTLIYIRNIGHTITEAINRQMNHYAYHIGQIVYIGTLVRVEGLEQSQHTQRWF